ncbi:sestrin-like protein [Pelomyxa schiedti]|nr:sestrin-like protein [Pelomyxa schiedti]
MTSDSIRIPGRNTPSPPITACSPTWFWTSSTANGDDTRIFNKAALSPTTLTNTTTQTASGSSSLATAQVSQNWAVPFTVGECSSVQYPPSPSPSPPLPHTNLTPSTPGGTPITEKNTADSTKSTLSSHNTTSSSRSAPPPLIPLMGQPPRASMPHTSLSMPHMSISMQSPPMLAMSPSLSLQPLLLDEGFGIEAPDEGGQTIFAHHSSLAEYNFQVNSPYSKFQRLLLTDPHRRKQALDELELLFRDTSVLFSNIHTVARLSTTCPFEDVTSALLRHLSRIPREAIPVYPRPSRFSEFPQTFDLKTLQSTAFIDYFGYSGTISNLDLVLSVHFDYFDAHCELLNTILRLENPMPKPLRHYVAILAASRRGCEYLVRQQEAEFRQSGGPEEWLNGVQNAPPKVKRLVKVIALLANQPWVLSRKHIEDLVQLEDPWSIAQIVAMIVIACEFISLSSLVFGCGINPESGFEVVASTVVPTPSPPSPVNTICTTAPAPSPPSPVNDADTSQDGSTEEEVGPDNWSRARPHDTSQSSRIDQFTAADGVVFPALPVASSPASVSISPNTTKYLCGKDRPHLDFDHRINPIFRVQDYCWSQHGYGLVEEFFKEAAPSLHKLFDRTMQMTYNNFSDKSNVRTEPFREAIWHYVHRIHGIFHDDYEYGEVNSFLSKKLKQYIKKVIFHPWTVTSMDFEMIGGLRPDEKLHLCLLALEAQKQACLLYGLYAVMRYKTYSPSSF